MSEQTIQDGLYSTPVTFDKYVCRSLGATTIKDLVKNKEISGLTVKECNSIHAKKPDVLVLDRNKGIVVFIEMKLPEEFHSDELKKAAKYQELDVAKKTKAKIYVISDGSTFIWFNPQTGEHILNEDGSPVMRAINPKDLSLEKQKELAEFIDDVCYCIDDTNNILIPKDYIDPTPLAKKTARILQNMSLSSAKNSLYTFVEMFTFKFLSDIGVLKDLYSFDSIYDIYERDKSQGAKNAFRQYLTTIRNQLLTLFPTAEDDTTIINGRLFHTKDDEKGNPIIIDSAADCFGKLLKCFKEYEDEHGKFLYIQKDFKSKLFETFMKNNSEKDGMGQFFTPLKVVQAMVDMVDVHEGMSICDPACGVAKFLLEASLKLSNPFYFENGKLKSRVKLVGLEKRMEDNNDDLTTILAKSNLLIYYSDLFKNNGDSPERIKLLSKEFLNTIVKSSHTTLGTLEHLVPESYDLILANPPYYQSAEITAQSKTIKLEGSDTAAYDKNGRGIEALFTEWIIKSLKKGGKANIILPDGIFTNLGNSKLKQFILDSCYIDSIISLPVGTFFTTPKKTYILTLHKRTDTETGEQPYPVYCYLCSTIGETMDTYRFDEPDKSDLREGVSLYNLYRNNKDNKHALAAVKADPRAKLINISSFKENVGSENEAVKDNWNIDNFWTKEEKIELGIHKEDTILSIDEFNSFISGVIDDIKNYQEAVKCLKEDM